MRDEPTFGFEKARHVPLRDVPWNANEAAKAIEEIVAETLAHFDVKRLWPAHPLDDGVSDGNTSFYFGATGVIWALEYLGRVGATKSRFDFRPYLPRLIRANRAEFARGPYSAHGSFLFGDLGACLVAMRLNPTSALADTAYARAEANLRLPIRELMWGMPGSMLACVHMSEMTGEPRWRAVFEAQTVRLLEELEETPEGPLWTQDLYGSRQRWLGPVHGYAGNMIPLIRGWHLLTDDRRVHIAEVVPRTLAANAWRSELGANWGAIAGRASPPKLCQHCHGAPGIVTTFANVPFRSPPLDALLLKGGEFVWAAGPLVKGSNLCHGTAGNGYAFLKLHRRTRDARWLDRARAFAMTAIAQFQQARDAFGQGRYALWTGDMGLAIYLWDCLTAEPQFPTIDVF